MIYLIQGVFFQGKFSLGIGCVDSDGIKAMFFSDLYRYMYSGMFIQNAFNKNKTIGIIYDGFGKSNIWDISFSENHLSFTKKYDTRDDLIYYEFHAKEDLIWFGEYNGRMTGNGISQCIVTPISDHFLSPEKAMMLLEKSEPFTWPKL